jgi:hypothetical protein
MAFHILIRAFSSPSRVLGCLRSFLTLRPSSSHKCSMGFRSWLFDHHGNTWMLFLAKRCVVLAAEWHGAPSWMNSISLYCCMWGMATAVRMSFWNFWRTVIALGSRPSNRATWNKKFDISNLGIDSSGI